MEQEQNKLKEILNEAINQAESKYDNLFDFKLYVGTDGRIEKIKIIDSKVTDKKTEIIEQLENWVFNSAKLDGKPVNFQFNLKVSHELLLNDKLISDFFNERSYFIAVNQMPEPIGGIEAIQKNIIYPESAKKEGVQGRVYVKAYIDEQGDVSKVDLIKGIGADCDESAMAAVKKTKFKPGMQNGKPVKVQVAVPILFQLK
ncbi:MAG: TonB family protein [Ignavibacteria bacterium]|nr:TonB family protein [Ignavibacteria bacterium]